MIKVLVSCPNPTDATSWYRAWGVFKHLTQGMEIDFFPIDDAKITMQVMGANNKPEIAKVIAWPVFENYDIWFIQRGFGEDLVNIIKSLACKQVKIIYELDDNLWEIPSYYGIKKHFPKNILNSIEEIMNLSDQIWVSTQGIADYLFELGYDPHVIPNAIDFNRYPIVDNWNKEGITLWRGSQTHQHDLAMFKKEMESYKDENIHFWGYNPVTNEPKLKLGKYTPLKTVDPVNYFNYMKYLQPKKVLVPLEPTLFNSCKSNIAWLEATMAGAITISNQHGEFKDKGFNFEAKPSDNEMFENWCISKEIALERYDLNKVNLIRKQLIESLIN